MIESSVATSSDPNGPGSAPPPDATSLADVLREVEHDPAAERRLRELYRGSGDPVVLLRLRLTPGDQAGPLRRSLELTLHARPVGEEGLAAQRDAAERLRRLDDDRARDAAALDSAIGRYLAPEQAADAAPDVLPLPRRARLTWFAAGALAAGLIGAVAFGIGSWVATHQSSLAIFDRAQTEPEAGVANFVQGRAQPRPESVRILQQDDFRLVVVAYLADGAIDGLFSEVNVCLAVYDVVEREAGYNCVPRSVFEGEGVGAETDSRTAMWGPDGTAVQVTD